MIIVFRRVHSDKNFRIFLQKACQKSMNFDLKIFKNQQCLRKKYYRDIEIHLWKKKSINSFRFANNGIKQKVSSKKWTFKNHQKLFFLWVSKSKLNQKNLRYTKVKLQKNNKLRNAKLYGMCQIFYYYLLHIYTS